MDNSKTSYENEINGKLDALKTAIEQIAAFVLGDDLPATEEAIVRVLNRAWQAREEE